ncbi:MAG TPA: hypothetical protein VKR24_13970, partial [Candidatus Limnocylindrales bacterium]|nr:hypothetical protein [Candidatus Limnocylindrales bacterium]
MGGGRRGGWSGPSFIWIAVITIALGSLATIAILLGSPQAPPTGSTGSGSPGASAGIAGTSGGPSGAPNGSFAAPTFGSTGPGASGAGSGAIGNVPIVPVVDFRSTLLSVTITDVRSILNGHQATFTSLELVSSEADPILAAIGVDRPDVPSRLILVANVATLDKDLAAHADRLAFIRADAVTPAVRAIGWGGTELFGVTRVKTGAAWKLNAVLPVSVGSAPAFNPA